VIPALSCWLLVSYIDAATKGRYIAWVVRTELRWDAFEWMADRGVRGWRIDVLAVLSIFLLSAGGGAIGWRFIAHFVTMFLLEHFLYWQSIRLMRIPQKQWFDGVLREPNFFESPDDPSWLRIGPFSFMWIHKRPVLLLIFLANAGAGIWLAL